MGFNYDAYEQEMSQGLSATLSTLMRKMYLWMTLALVITGVTAYGVASSPKLLEMIFANQIAFWGIIIAEFGLVWFLSARMHAMSLTVSTLLFALYSALNGLTLSILLIAYTASSVTAVFFITAGTFAVMSLIGFTTKTDLSSMGKILMMAVIGLVIASIVNIFMHSSGLSMIISYVGVLIFVGLTAYDTQKIKKALATQQYADEEGQKVALMGAMSLYLDFINLFIYLLRILGDRK